jgi:hypothetical protein
LGAKLLKKGGSEIRRQHMPGRLAGHQAKGRAQTMMSGLSRGFRLSGVGAGLGFAIKVIGVGLFAGLVLTYCNMLLDACIAGIR